VGLFLNDLDKIKNERVFQKKKKKLRKQLDSGAKLK